MPNTLDFSVTLPSRVGHAPTVNNWTYHHILPWRYYFLTGYILTYFARFRLMTTAWLTGYSRTSANAAFHTLLQNEFNAAGSDESARTRALRGEFGSWGTFSVSESVTDLLDLAETMHGPGGANAIRTRMTTDNALSPLSLAELCTNPEFGGFAAMYPGQRLDDPQSNPEPRRPYNMPTNWWSLVTAHKKLLEAVAPNIAVLPPDRRVAVSINGTNRDLLIAQITQLSNYYGYVYDFDPRDWDFKRLGMKVPWTFVTNCGAHAGQGECSAVFALNTDGQGGTTTTHANIATVPRGTMKIMRSNQAGLRDRMKFHSA